MDLSKFSQKNRERCESALGFQHKLTDWSLSDWMTAIMGELGEAANVAKKLNRVRDGIRGNKETTEELEDKLARELADVFIYLDLTFQRLGLDTSREVSQVFNSKSEQIGSPIRIEND
jgi:NTP pyrophosphatase (non-canonical NTP hydrolase)